MSYFSINSVGPTSLSLLERVKLDDAEAWSRLAKLYGPLIYQWTRRCGVSSEDAADVVQEVFVVLMRQLANFRRETSGDTFRGWLWTITRNKVRDYFRRASHRAAASGGSVAYELMQELSAEANEPFCDDPQGLAVEWGIVARAIELIRADFAANTWQAFWLSAVDRREAADIADELGLTKHAVHQAKYRVLQRLRAELCDPVETSFAR